MTSAPLLDRRFHLREYNCWDYVREVWLELTGRDIGRRTPEIITKGALLGRFEAGVLEFTEIERPAEPCIVLLEQRSAIPHVGVFTRGRVQQLRSSGVSRLPLKVACLGYQRARFFHD